MGDVEIKVSFDGDEVDDALAALALEDFAAKKRKVFFSEVVVRPDQPLPLADAARPG